MACLNEAETLERCIRKAQRALHDSLINGEIIVADNGSTDGSVEIAEGLGARVARISAKGYGNALMGGIAAAAGKFIIMGDADDSYDFGDIPKFLTELRAGAQLVMGNRFRGGIKPGAMPPLHQYFVNPALTRIGRLFFGSPVNDFYCGLRGFRKAAYQSLGLRTTGMEFATEMVVKATLLKQRIAEVPATLAPDGRSRPPHLRTWRDGWRHLRFLLLFSPRWLFFYPGIGTFFLGLIISLWLLPGPQTIGRWTFDVDTLTYSLGLVLIGAHISVFAVSARVFGTQEGFLPPNPKFERIFNYINLEVGLIFGGTLLLVGLVILGYAIHIWHSAGFGDLSPQYMLRLTLPSATCFMLGVEAIF